MIYPVWLDGPLEDQQHPVDDSAVEQGIYRHTPHDIYTFTRVQMLGRTVVAASVRESIPPLDLLFAKLASASAGLAAES